MQNCDSNIRARHVAQMRANFRVEGIFGDIEDLQLQSDYIAGKLELYDLLEAAKHFAESLKQT